MKPEVKSETKSEVKPEKKSRFSLKRQPSIGKSMKVGTKIMAVVGLCLVFLAIVAVTGIWQMSKIGGEIEGIANRDIPMTEALTKVTIHQLEQAINFERAIRIGEEMQKHPAKRTEFEESVRKFEALSHTVEKEIVEVSKLAQQAHDHAATDEGRKVFQEVVDKFKKIGSEHADYDKHSIDAFKLLLAGKIDEALTLLPKIEAEQEDLDHSLEALLEQVETFTRHAVDTAEAHEKLAISLMSILAAAAFVLGLGISVMIVRRSITRPLAEIVEALDRLTAGDTSAEAKVHSDDEIGAVARSFEAFKEVMIRTKELENQAEVDRVKAAEERRELMHKLADDFEASVGTIVETVASSSTQLNSTAQSMSAISEETSSQATNVASASEEATSNVQTAATAAEEMSTSIGEINRQVEQTSKAAGQAVSEVEQTSGQMKDLVETADKIETVVGMISEIADQTNLLALNATIESARAGEAGKGFAVVASEVKELAGETGKATEEIVQQIENVQKAIQEAVGSMAEVGKVVGELNEASTTIAAAMAEQGAATEEIARSVQEAAAGTQEVSTNIAGVNEASQQAGAASAQVLSSAGELSENSGRLKKEVANFLSQVRAA
ncbi:MAG: HAMP domain-containing methyl-accepting chemotaxis protein [Methyloligellaceae bacterium]